MKKTKVLLVVPPNSLEERYGKLKLVGTMYPSMGLAAVGAVAEQEGFRIKAIDCEAEGLDYDELGERIKEYQPDVIGMQTFCNTINRALKIAKQVKEGIDPDIKIVLGGVQAALFPEKYVANQYVDFVVVGEGEIIFKNLLNTLENNQADFSGIPGLVWKKNSQIVSNPPEKLISNLDELPFPARHLFNLNLYHASAQLRRHRTFHIIVSRGCPFNCSFCSVHKIFGRNYRFRSSQKVIDEIKFLKEKYNIDGLQFYDDTLSINKPWLIELCNKMIDEKINLPWACFTRVDCVNPELLEKMKQAGCYQIFYGVECANQRLLDIINKSITIQQIKDAFRWAKKAGIETLASFIIGLPTETVEEARQTANLAIEIDADYAHWEMFVPHPGTNIYEFALRHGRLLTTDLNKHCPWLDEPVYVPDNRTAQELKETKKWIFCKFHLRPGYLLKRLHGFLKLPFNRVIKLVRSGIIMIVDRSG